MKTPSEKYPHKREPIIKKNESIKNKVLSDKELEQLAMDGKFEDLEIKGIPLGRLLDSNLEDLSHNKFGSSNIAKSVGMDVYDSTIGEISKKIKNDEEAFKQALSNYADTYKQYGNVSDDAIKLGLKLTETNLTLDDVKKLRDDLYFVKYDDLGDKRFYPEDIEFNKRNADVLSAIFVGSSFEDLLYEESKTPFEGSFRSHLENNTCPRCGSKTKDISSRFGIQGISCKTCGWNITQ